MASKTKTMNREQIDALYKRTKPISIKESQPQYTLWQLKTSECTITAYQSGKVVFQGSDLSWLEDSPDTSPSKTAGRSPAAARKQTADKNTAASSALADTFPMAGSDECGVGDFFGPITVAAVIVPDQQTAESLRRMQITDSKAMTDTLIETLAPQIKAMVPWSVQVLEPARYNAVHDDSIHNMNWFKSQMHNQAYLNLAAKGYDISGLKIIDQFCVPATYYRHLSNTHTKQVVKGIHFETKAESKYIAVAAASVLARAAFLDYWKKMEEKYGMPFIKGASSKTDACGRKFMKDHTKEDLERVAKLNFANVNRIL